MSTVQASQATQDGLFNAPTKPGKTVEKRPKSARTVARTADTGEDAPTIVNAWEKWLTEAAALTLTPSLRGMTLRTVKHLIKDGYTAPQIKWSLSFWVAEWSTKTTYTVPTLSPKRLEEIALTLRVNTTPQAIRWRNNMRAEVARINSRRARTKNLIADLAKEPQ